MKIDLTGKTFDRLYVVRQDGKNNQGQTMWKCECECGEVRRISTSTLNSGHTKSCGCLRRDLNTTHGFSRTRLYHAWYDMKSRCYGKSKNYKKHYQDRGIKVCPEWKDSFEAFKDWSLANGFKEELSLDRIDVDKDYSPDNCRWATDIQQANNKTDSRHITLDGETKTIADWARHYGINKGTIFTRLCLGWNERDAITKPINKRYSSGTILEFDGKSQCLSEWARELGITMQSLTFRLNNGWTLEKALTTPRGKTGPRRSKPE